MARKPPRIDTAAKIEAIMAEAKRDVIDSLEHDFAWSITRCDSPIEQLLAVQLLCPVIAREFETRIQTLSPRSGLIEDCQAPPFHGIYIWQQIKIGDYRVDFLLDEVPRDHPPLIVECDGHDWHERTKEQAQRDKARDRFLVSRGFRILRFTGSEIFNDPEAAAFETLQILTGTAG